MSANRDFVDLKSLQNNIGYQKLQGLWAHEYAQIMQGLQRSASRNNESNWRYKAGEMKGFELAVGQLERALMQLEKDSDVENPGTEELLKELRGETTHE
jgi:hypothetical protein